MPVIPEPSVPADEQRVMQHFVFAWQDTCPKYREPIEMNLLNAGAKKIGKVGRIVKYCGRTMRTEEGPLFPGDLCKITQSGWMYKGVLMAEIFACLYKKRQKKGV